MPVGRVGSTTVSVTLRVFEPTFALRVVLPAAMARTRACLPSKLSSATSGLLLVH